MTAYPYVVTFYAWDGVRKVRVRAWSAEDARYQAELLLDRSGCRSYGVKSIEPDESEGVAPCG